MPELDQDITDEEEEIREWHETFLLELGVSPLPASVYADKVDPHRVAWLINQGCPPDLAVDIIR